MKITKIWAWSRWYVWTVLNCPKGVICSRCLRLNFFFDDVGRYPRDREKMLSRMHRQTQLIAHWQH